MYAFRSVIGLQLDRGNLGNAATDNLMKDIGINQNEYNNGSTYVSSRPTLGLYFTPTDNLILVTESR
jgi:hypothetical protein